MDKILPILIIMGIILVYLGCRYIYMKYQSPFTLPVLLATVVIIVILLTFNVSYETFLTGGKWIDMLLGPAVVALAYPLYNQRKLLKDFYIPITIGVFTGALIGVMSGVILAKLLRFNDSILYSIAPKSVTTPVAMDISGSLGGISPLAAVFVMIAGIGGAVMSTFTFKYTGINHFIGRGVGIGCASHAIGTSKAMEYGEKEGAVSTIAMVMSAVIVSLISPLVLLLF
ncbi:MULTISPECIES: LrgB family protein [Bacillaceae]|uniref:LrgB family protein n=1 Tax=Evansella alkalicola TaxID=745819 RepID=A0ABS6JSL5_9BACI|nr:MULTISPECIES: LrgB family protein [Bacillaceae]MBU9721553.1 LrgB family protein [Bacillus alkalicola]